VSSLPLRSLSTTFNEAVEVSLMAQQAPSTPASSARRSSAALPSPKRRRLEFDNLDSVLASVDLLKMYNATGTLESGTGRAVTEEAILEAVQSSIKNHRGRSLAPCLNRRQTIPFPKARRAWKDCPPASFQDIKADMLDREVPRTEVQKLIGRIVSYSSMVETLVDGGVGSLSLEVGFLIRSSDAVGHADEQRPVHHFGL
jgi:hypothetical protein